MSTKFRVILSATGIVALLASPAMAKTSQRHGDLSSIYIPNGVRGSVASYGAAEGGPYTPSMPAVSHGFSRDFQTGPRN